jgi:hypothetical protein
MLVSNAVKVLSIAALLVGTAWILLLNEATRVDSQIKNRAIIKNGADRMSQGA